NNPEWQDGQPDPIDRWSYRVIWDLAQQIGATPRFPFGPDAAPFLTWAINSDAAWPSPVGMVVQAKAGLMVSYRGALVFDHEIHTEYHSRPCDTCAAPCLQACPVGALDGQGYNVPACHSHLRSANGTDCTHGCLVRRACPISQGYERDSAQSGYHMAQFVKS
ncbi:MAG: ferredoxin, partial [Pseudomonadota bacterium]